jgi:acetoacetate decarboxylase
MAHVPTPLPPAVGAPVANGPMYRMPVGFGPSIGPRQGPGGRSFNGTWSRCMTVGVAYRTDRDRVAELLPPGFESASEAVVRVQALFNTDLAWLAGRGYNWVEVVFPAVYRGERDVVEGDFVAVMWESIAEPIIPGREEIGLPKLFADIPPVRPEAGGTRMTASWDQFEFLDMRLDGLSVGPWPAERETQVEPVRLGLGGSAGRHRLYYKYIPRTGEWGAADAAYATASAPSNYAMKVLESWSGTGTVRFRPARWEDLPTFSHVVNALAELPVIEYLGASMSRVMMAFNDLTDQRILR